MSDNAVNSGQELPTMVTNIKFFSYMFSTLLCLMVVRMYWRLPYWRYITAVSLFGMMGTLLNTVETSVLIPRGKLSLFRVSVLFSESFWFTNELSVVLISYMRCKPLLIVAPLTAERVRWMMYIICPVLLGLRIYILTLRFIRGQSWDETIAKAHRPYFSALASVDLLFSSVFAFFIWNHTRIKEELDSHSQNSDLQQTGLPLHKRADEMMLILQISSSMRLLIVNVIMILVAVSFFASATPGGAYLVDLSSCFKFNFGTFFLIDLIFMRQQRVD
jgi:hypothetical protein